MTFDPVAALAHYHAVLDAQDLVGVARLLAAEARYVSAGLGDVAGRDAIVAAMRDYFAACPDHQAFDDDITALGPRQAQSRWRLRATHAVTGAVVVRHGVETVVFDENGKILSIVAEDHG